MIAAFRWKMNNETFFLMKLCFYVNAFIKCSLLSKIEVKMYLLKAYKWNFCTVFSSLSNSEFMVLMLSDFS